jgi:glucose-1-phosphate cytidylyltransferase
LEVVILCGGKGTRSYPFTEYFPKVLMPVGGTPIVVHLTRLYAAQGVKRFVLAAGHRQEMLRDYFDGRFQQWDISIIDTGADSDTGERIRRCAPYLSQTFFATYGDGLGDVDVNELLRFHKRTGGLATLTSVPLRSQFGLVISDTAGLVTDFKEKPIIQEHWINAGFFVFEKSVFDVWDGQNLETEVLPNIARTKRLHTYRHYGFWKSMDTSKDQQELEHIFATQNAPWAIRAATAVA